MPAEWVLASTNRATERPRAEAALVIQNHYTPLLLKENPLSIEAIMARLDTFMPEHLASKAAIDIALHDLKGKMLNVPVYELLGGRARDKVQLLAPQVSRGEPIEQAREAARLVGEGFQGTKTSRRRRGR